VSPAMLATTYARMGESLPQQPGLPDCGG
jgi:hypothetical protein